MKPKKLAYIYSQGNGDSFVLEPQKHHLPYASHQLVYCAQMLQLELPLLRLGRPHAVKSHLKKNETKTNCCQLTSFMDSDPGSCVSLVAVAIGCEITVA